MALFPSAKVSYTLAQLLLADPKGKSTHDVTSWARAKLGHYDPPTDDELSFLVNTILREPRPAGPLTLIVTTITTRSVLVAPDDPDPEKGTP